MTIQERKQWVAKHDIQLKSFDVYCPECDVLYTLDAQIKPKKLYCPFCDGDIPLQTRSRGWSK